MRRNVFWFFVATILVLGKPSGADAQSLAAYCWEPGTTRQVAYIAADGDIHELYNIANAGWAAADLTAITGAPPPAAGSPLAGYSWDVGASKQVAYIAADGHIHELYINPADDNWYHADLTALAGAPPPAAGSPLVGYGWELGFSKQVAYIARDGHIHELYVVPGGTWSDGDLTYLAGAPPPAGGSPLAGYSWEAGLSKQVVYLGADGHIHELFVKIGGDWSHGDLTFLSGAPLPAAGSPLAGYSWEIGGTKYVTYLAADGHLHELYVVLGSGWRDFDFTAIRGIPSPAYSSPVTGYSSSVGAAINSKQVLFIGRDDGDIHDLSQGLDGRLKDTDLTLDAPPDPAGSAVVGYSCSSASGYSKQVVYQANDRHIIEMFEDADGNWWGEDLTDAGGPPAR